MVTLWTAVGEWTAWFDRYTGLGPFALRLPDGTQGVPRVSRRGVKESDMKRPSAVPASHLPSMEERQECVTLSRFPTLESLLCDPNWEDATGKGKRILMVFVDDRATRILVKLEQDSLKASCVAKDLDEALMTMELLLKTDQVVWEQDQAPTPGRRKKGK